MIPPMLGDTYTGRSMSLADSTTAVLARAAGAAGGLMSMAGLGGARVSKLTIHHETWLPGVFSGRFTALFNPTEVKISGGVDWRMSESISQKAWSSKLEATPADYRPLSVSLGMLFDTGGGPTGLMALAGDALTGGLAMRFAPPTGTSVLGHTQRVMALAQPLTELHRPPICQLWWGPYKLIQGALTRVEQTFDHWLPDGTPVRARVDCTFTEHEADVELHSPDVEKTHTVRRGDNLPALAAAYYGDPTRWPAIARFNGLEDPRTLRSGAVLRIPALGG